MTVGAASATVPGGATKTVSVSLNGLGKKLLGKSHRLKATLSVTASGSPAPILTHLVTFAMKA